MFFAVQDISYNLKAIAAEEKTIKDCEQELIVLRSIGLDTGERFYYLLTSWILTFLHQGARSSHFLLVLLLLVQVSCLAK